jgi:hypothetical protein
VRKSRLFAAAGLTSLAVVLAACGTSTLGSQGASQQQRPAARATVLASIAAVKTASYRFTLQLAMSGLGQALSSMGSAPGSTPPASDLSINGSGEFSASQDAIEMTIGGAMTSLVGVPGAALQEIVFTRTGVIYVRLPASPGASVKWFEVSAGSGSEAAAITSLLKSLGSVSPSSYLSTFGQAITSVRAIGTANVEGTSTTEYAVTENLRSVMDKMMSNGLVGNLGSALSGRSGLGVQKFTQTFEAALNAMPATLTIDIYLDGAGHLRRLSVTIPLGAMFAALFSGLGSSGAGISSVSQSEMATIQRAFSLVSESFTMDLTSYAGDIHISAPPASEVTQSDPLAGQGSSASASASSSFAS